VKVLVIGAGASWSTKDVENGVVDGLRHAGVDVGRYALDIRLMASDEYLHWIHRRAKRQRVEMPKPTTSEIQIHALKDALTAALGNGADWVVLVSGMFVPLDFIRVIRSAGLPVAMVMTESPYDIEHEVVWAGQADHVWTSERSSVPVFAGVAPSASYLPHAWRQTVHQAEPTQFVASHDVVFVGSCFDEREALLNAVDWTGIDLGLYGNWQRLSKKSALRKFVKSSVIDNTVTAALYRNAKIGLNLYRTSKGWSKGAPKIGHAESLNPRAYELAACGCFHLSERRAEVEETFGGLVPTFSSGAECEALIRQWLADDGERARVASRLPAAVAGQTWRERGQRMRADLQQALPGALALVVQRVSVKQVSATQALATEAA
jgi:spore maturation protein CgeB